MEIKASISKLVLLKFNIFWKTKGTLSKVKRQFPELEKITGNETTGKKNQTLPNIQAVHVLSNRKMNNLIKKWSKDLNRYFSKEDIYMTNKHMKRCSTSFILRIMQIKTTMKYYPTKVRKIITEKFVNDKCWRECGEKATLFHLLVWM